MLTMPHYQLESCNLPTLASRMCYLKLCFLYQVIQGESDFPCAPIVRRNLLLNLNNSAFLLLRPVDHSNAHQFSFFPRTIDFWNSLPFPVHSCDSWNSFKSFLLQLNYQVFIHSLLGVQSLVSTLLIASLHLAGLLQKTKLLFFKIAELVIRLCA